MFLPITKSIELWNEEDLKSLCNDNIPEFLRLDYKRELKIDSTSEREELAKDVSSMANASGGVIIYGIEERKDPKLGSIANKLYPIKGDISIKDKITRIINSRVSPGMMFYIYDIKSDEGFYIVIYIPESYIKPHSYKKGEDQRYYIRRNQDNFPMNETEIRAMYFQTSQLHTSLKQRYLELDLDIGDVLGSLILVSMPLIPELNVIDTLKYKPEDITKLSYHKIFNSMCLSPRVDRFEEIKHMSDIIGVIRLFRNGEFIIGQGIKKIENKQISLNCISIYRILYQSLKFFGELYSMVQYFGESRLWMEIKNLDHDYIKIYYCDSPDVYNYKIKNVIISKDICVENLKDPTEICNTLIRYFAQGFGADEVQDSDLEELHKYINLYF